MLISRTLLALATGLSLTVVPAAAGQASPASCPAQSRSEFGGCLSAGVELRGLPRVGEVAELRVTVAAGADRTGVDIQIELPATLAWERAPIGLTARPAVSHAPEDRAGISRVGVSRSLRAGRPVVLTGHVRAVGSGPTHIRVYARGSAPDITSASAFLTIGTAETTAGFAAATDAAAIPLTGGAPSRAYPRFAVKPAGSSTSAGAACASGSFAYADTSGVNRISANFGVQVYDADASGGDDLLASGVTDAAGAFRLCFGAADEEGGGQDAYAVFTTENAQWRIQHTKLKTAYRFRTETIANVTATAAFGARQSGDPVLTRGVQAFDQVAAAWNWTPGGCWDMRDTICRTAKVNWAPDATDGTWYDTRDDSVYLLADDPRSAELVLHEFGHLIMDDVYEDAFPSSPNCSPHYIPRTSSKGCAWTEGFATLYEVMVLGQPIFRWADGSTLDVEQPTWGTSGWDDGDRVEGRVLGALIDVFDTTNEGLYDRCSEDPRQTIWTTFVGHKSTTFSAFWSDRAADGFDTSRTALGCLYQNTISYGGYRP
ncbi:MAG: hypothetical protein HOV79_04385 [Hamadaea sp.]|nr:hypothetical protein [Hamadaea sp.]